MKNVIAIYSSPQECGDDSLRFISCETGQVVLEINLSPYEDYDEKITTRILKSPVDIFYDLCTEQRFEEGCTKDNFTYCISLFEDRECKKHLRNTSSQFWTKYGKENLTVLGIEDLGEIVEETKKLREVFPEVKIGAVHLWKYIVGIADTRVDYVYHPETDTVYQEILQKCGIECPPKDRWDIQKLSRKIADAMGYKMLNLIYG